MAKALHISRTKAALYQKSLQSSTRYYSAPASDAVPPAKQQYIPTNGTYPKGFFAGVAHCGIKPSNTSRPDLTLLASDRPCSAAAVFTKNRFQAAPVTVSRDLLRQRKGQGIRGVVINSGRANAVTGTKGVEDATEMGKVADDSINQHFGTGAANPSEDSPSTLVMSTGVIGQTLPMPKIVPQIPNAAKALDSTHDAWLAAAKAICTTDTFPKLASRSFHLPSFPGTSFSMVGLTKGAGMIHPNMATLLGVILTDAPIAPPVLDQALRVATDYSFNSISIDGDTSTNDTLALLANGAAVHKSSWSGAVTDATGPDANAFAAELTTLATDLSHLVVRDAEGATKFVTLRILGSRSRTEGRRIASTVATSPLVKTALYGRDANWGRVLCAIGYADGLEQGAIDPSKISVSFVSHVYGTGKERIALFVKGEPAEVDEEKAARLLEQEDLEIEIDLGIEPDAEEVLFWTCDLSHEYVTINGDYRT